MAAMPLDTGRVSHLHLVADGDPEHAPMAAHQPSVDDGVDIGSALRALKTIQQACADTGTPVSVCGEMAGRPLEAFALLALGFDRLSMPPAGIGPVKQMVLSCDREAARRNVEALLKTSAGSLRGEIETLARKLYVAV